MVEHLKSTNTSTNKFDQTISIFFFFFGEY